MRQHVELGCQSFLSYIVLNILLFKLAHCSAIHYHALLGLIAHYIAILAQQVALYRLNVHHKPYLYNALQSYEKKTFYENLSRLFLFFIIL